MKKIQLQTGTLTVEESELLPKLIGFGSRENKKRGFLFVSKILGKHLPAKPSAMKEVQQTLARLLADQLNEKATVVIGFAETATGIGNGVFEALAKENSFYIHTTRYHLSRKRLVEFQEEHCHAPSHILYQPEDQEIITLLEQAENVVLVDDEITTGNTLRNIVSVLKEKLPAVKNYFAVAPINWMKEFPDDLKFISLYNGAFSFEQREITTEAKVISVNETNLTLDSEIPYNFGRFGLKKRNYDFTKLVNLVSLSGKKVLLLGTGEFMHPSFLLGLYLEENGIEVYVQSTTRSPVKVDGDIRTKISYKDNYHENIDNFLYNVIDQKYDKVLICYETPNLPENHRLKEQLSQSFADIEEIFWSVD